MDVHLALPTSAYIERLHAACLRRPTGSRAAGPCGAGAPSTPMGVTNPDGYSVLLSHREIEVLRLMAEGRSNREIASTLCLAVNTVKRHAYNIYAKLHVRKRTQAVWVARQLNLLP